MNCYGGDGIHSAWNGTGGMSLRWARKAPPGVVEPYAPEKEPGDRPADAAVHPKLSR